MTMVAGSLFIFRRREPAQTYSYRVPFYPLTPIIFTATCLYMLYSSLAYTGIGALFGAGVLLLGRRFCFSTGARRRCAERRNEFDASRKNSSLPII
jgi:amino acid transporter